MNSDIAITVFAATLVNLQRKIVGVNLTCLKAVHSDRAKALWKEFKKL